MIPKTQAIKLKINGTPSNFRTPCTRNNIVRGQPMGWEKIFPNHIFDKGLISRKCKEIL